MPWVTINGNHVLVGEDAGWQKGGGWQTRHANAERASHIINHLGHKSVVYKNPNTNVAAIYSNTDNTIHVNASHKFWQDPVANAAKQEGYLSSTSPEHILHHEIGHALYTPPDNFMGGIRQQDMARTVSRYAAMNPKEFVSEVHAGMTVGKTYSPEVMTAFKQYAIPRKL